MRSRTCTQNIIAPRSQICSVSRNRYKPSRSRRLGKRRRQLGESRRKDRLLVVCLCGCLLKNDYEASGEASNYWISGATNQTTFHPARLDIGGFLCAYFQDSRHRLLSLVEKKRSTRLPKILNSRFLDPYSDSLEPRCSSAPRHYRNSLPVVSIYCRH